MKFSRDGKYLAAGGQDMIVRVWSVISTPEERRKHESLEEAVRREVWEESGVKVGPVNYHSTQVHPSQHN